MSSMLGWEAAASKLRNSNQKNKTALMRLVMQAAFIIFNCVVVKESYRAKVTSSKDINARWFCEFEFIKSNLLEDIGSDLPPILVPA